MAAEKSQNILFALFVVMVSATAVESSADNRNASTCQLQKINRRDMRCWQIVKAALISC
jgi:hypothetical protein